MKLKLLLGALLTMCISGFSANLGTIELGDPNNLGSPSVKSSNDSYFFNPFVQTIAF